MGAALLGEQAGLPKLLCRALDQGHAELCIEVAWAVAHATHKPDVVLQQVQPSLTDQLIRQVVHAQQEVRITPLSKIRTPVELTLPVCSLS